MPTFNFDQVPLAQLRLAAESRLKEGSAPHSRDCGVSTDTLALLYRLASDPASAADALKLLHELQVYQVELDLQYGQLEANERELANALAHYKTLYEHAPVGYVVISFDGRIIETNLAGIDVLDIEQVEVGVYTVDNFLAPESRSTFAGLLKDLREGGSKGSCEVQSRDRDGGSRTLCIDATRLPGGEVVLMTVSVHAADNRISQH